MEGTGLIMNKNRHGFFVVYSTDFPKILLQNNKRKFHAKQKMFLGLELKKKKIVQQLWMEKLNSMAVHSIVRPSRMNFQKLKKLKIT